MSVDADILRRLAALDLPKEAFQEVLSIIADMAAKSEAKRKAAQNRTAKWREGQNQKRHGDVTVTTPERHELRHDPSSLSSLPSSAEPLTDSKQEEEVVVEGRDTARRVTPRGSFDSFWAIYPHKVGKRDARRAFEAALQRVDFETLMAGLSRYAAKTDDRPWCNPATWLRQDRWADQPAMANGARASPVNGYGAAAPRPGSREDTRERTVNALRKLDLFVNAGADDPGAGSGDRAPILRIIPNVKPP